MSFFNRTKLGRIISRTTSDVEAVRDEEDHGADRLARLEHASERDARLVGVEEGARLVVRHSGERERATAGQACVAATRMVVPADRKDEVVETVAAAYSKLVVGPPTDPGAHLGPVISAAQRERCERFVGLAEDHGGKVAVGGGRPSGLERGYYFEPTVLDLPDNANPAAQEEIFGPVIGVIGYRDIDHAVAIANDTAYGLSGQVYGRDTAAATAVARRLRTGAVNVNSFLFSAYAPGGGYKQSGLGRERGPEGVRTFQELKHMAIGELR